MLLEVPVSIAVVGRNQLLVVGGGERRLLPLPIEPYEYFESEKTGDPVKLIGGGETLIQKVSYPIIPALMADGENRSERLSMDYILTLIKDYPEEIKKLAAPAEPYPIFTDIETAATSSHFSKAERDEILTIQVGFPDTDPIVLEGNEAQMIRDFISLVKQSPTGRKPDMIVGYFINKFDLPYIKKRAAVCGISYDEWTSILGDVVPRDSAIHYPNWIYATGRTKGKDKEKSTRREEHIDIVRGLMTFDLYIHAKSDLILKDLPSRSLKNVSSFYGATDVMDLSDAEKGKMAELLVKNRDRFMKYAISDIKQTNYLYNIYISRVAAASNLLATPLTMTHRMSSGQKSYLALYREVRANGFYSLKKNHERYENLYSRAEKFQGALVDCFRTGYFPHTIYVDAKCMRKGTLVMGDAGYRPVESLHVGMSVYSDEGYKKIVHVAKAMRDDIVTITTANGNSITVSAEHRFPVYVKWKKAGYSSKDYIDVKLAKDITKNDILLECYHYPTTTTNSYWNKIHDVGKAELVGIFDAEGYMQDSTRSRIRHDRNGSIQKGVRYTQLSFTIHSKETKLRDRIVELMKQFTDGSPNILYPKGKNSAVIQYGNHDTYDSFDRLLLEVRGSIMHDESACRAYLRGLFSGDGTYNKTRRTINLTQSTENKDIMDLARQCLTRCGIPYCVTGPHKVTAVKKLPAKSTIHSAYKLEIPSRFVKEFMERIGFIEDKKVPSIVVQSKPKDYIRPQYSLVKVRSVKREKLDTPEEMIDIMLEDQNHPYFFANGILTHNSMYPNIMHDFNLGYDRYQVEKFIPYIDYAKEFGIAIPPHVLDAEKEGRLEPIPDFHPQIRAEGTSESMQIFIPDDNYQMVIVFRMNLRDDGFIRHLINHYNSVRDEYKKLAQKFKDTDKIQSMNYDSTQQEAKIINNTIYGIQGNKYYEVADLPAAIFVTAIGRWIMTEMIALFQKYDRDACIEIDTDGLLLDYDKVSLTIEEINAYLRTKIHDTFKIPNEKIKFLLEFEGEGSVYMYKTKNYLIRGQGKDRWKAKGSAFARYDTAPVIQRAVRIMGNAIMMHPITPASYQQAMDEARNIWEIPTDEFMFSRTIKKSVDSYKGFQKVKTFVRAIPDGLNKRDKLAMLKRRAKQWVNTAYEKDNGKSRLLSNITNCTTEGELDLVLGKLSVRNNEQSGNYYILDMIMRLISRGEEVEEDDIIQYYYTKTAERYTLAQDMKPGIEIDRDRYLEEINLFLERFEYANPMTKSLDMMEFLK